jgi:hypothetical protein
MGECLRRRQKTFAKKALRAGDGLVDACGRELHPIAALPELAQKPPGEVGLAGAGQAEKLDGERTDLRRSRSEPDRSAWSGSVWPPAPAGSESRPHRLRLGRCRV